MSGEVKMWKCTRCETLNSDREDCMICRHAKEKTTIESDDKSSPKKRLSFAILAVLAIFVLGFISAAVLFGNNDRVAENGNQTTVNNDIEDDEVEIEPEIESESELEPELETSEFEFVDEKVSNPMVVASTHRTIALHADGTVWELRSQPESDIEYRAIAIQIDIEDVKKIAASNNHAVALKRDGTVWGWGYNRSGQLGDGTVNDSAFPVKAEGADDMVAIAACGATTIALHSDGTVWTWGSNSIGQLGNGQFGNYSTLPMQIESIDNIISISTRNGRVFALRDDGTVWGWGYDGFDRIIRDYTTCIGLVEEGFSHEASCLDLIPTQVSELYDVLTIDAGSQFIVTSKIDGTYWIKGLDVLGGTYRLEQGRDYNIFPVLIGGESNIVEVSASNMLMALDDEGFIWKWRCKPGRCYHKIEVVDCREPIQIEGLYNIVSFDRGSSGDAVALTRDGNVFTWINRTGNTIDGFVQVMDSTGSDYFNLGNNIR